MDKKGVIREDILKQLAFDDVYLSIENIEKNDLNTDEMTKSEKMTYSNYLEAFKRKALEALDSI